MKVSDYLYFFDMLPIPLTFVAHNGKVIRVNERYKSLIGYTLADIPHINDWWELAYPDENYRQWAKTNWEQAVAYAFKCNKEVMPHEYKVTCKDGNIRTFEISMIKSPEGMLASFIDLTDKNTALENVNLLANYDSLTQLPNRRILEKRYFEYIRAQSSDIALLLIDIDNFKHLNDQYGHHAGDEVLAIASQRFLQCVRDDDLVARIGGDEFVVMVELAEQQKVSLDDIARRLLAVFDSAIMVACDDNLHDIQSVISISIGIVTLFKETPLPLNESLVLADKAMYQSKKQGKGCFTHYQFEK